MLAYKPTNEQTNQYTYKYYTPKLLARPTPQIHIGSTHIQPPTLTPAVIPPNAAEEIAKVFAVVADAANIMLTAGAPTPADTTETVTQTRITPVPMATFLSIVSVDTSSIS